MRLWAVHGLWEYRRIINSERSTGRCAWWLIDDRASLKLLAKVPRGEQVRLVYDVAQTPVQRLLASGVLSVTRQRELSRSIRSRLA